MTCWHMKRMLIYCYSFRHVDKLFFGGSALGLLFWVRPSRLGECFSFTSSLGLTSHLPLKQVLR